MLHDWNAILVPDGMDFGQVLAAQRLALTLKTGQPTAIVYRTRKGWQYGVEGKASHGAGHGLCAEGFFQAVQPFMATTGAALPRCEAADQRCRAGKAPEIMEECFWEALTVIRAALERNRPMVEAMARRLREAKGRLDRSQRKPRPQAPNVAAAFALADRTAGRVPPELTLKAGQSATLRGELGRC